jgi:hypothetical protein
MNLKAIDDQHRLYRHSTENSEQKSALRNLLDGGAGEFHRGDCIGADSEAHDIADECGYGIILPPPTNHSEREWREVPRHMKRPEKPYLDRNQGWSREFHEPIALPGGRTLLTLHNAATYITGLSKKEAALSEWQAAIEALMLVADRGGPTMFARIGVMRALNRHIERVFDSSRKEKHWGKRKLARDR